MAVQVTEIDITFDGIFRRPEMQTALSLMYSGGLNLNLQDADLCLLCDPTIVVSIRTPALTEMKLDMMSATSTNSTSSRSLQADTLTADLITFPSLQSSSCSNSSAAK